MKLPKPAHPSDHSDGLHADGVQRWILFILGGSVIADILTFVSANTIYLLWGGSKETSRMLDRL